MLGCIRLELLSGAQPDERFQRLRDYLRFFPNLSVDAQDDESAAACYNVCRRNGIQGGLFDLLICALAIRHRMPIFSTDRDFTLFARYLPIDLHSPRYTR
jgi:predicted nucleic acid-binding protein